MRSPSRGNSRSLPFRPRMRWVDPVPTNEQVLPRAGRGIPGRRNTSVPSKDGKIGSFSHEAKIWLENSQRMRRWIEDHPECLEELDASERRALESMLAGSSEREGSPNALEYLRQEKTQEVFPIAFSDHLPSFEEQWSAGRPTSWDAFRKEQPYVARALEELREKELQGSLAPDEGFGRDDWKDSLLNDLMDPFSSMSLEEQSARQKQWIDSQAEGVDAEIERWVEGKNLDQKTLQEEADAVNEDIRLAFERSRELHGSKIPHFGVFDSSFWDKEVIHARSSEGSEDYQRWSTGPFLDVKQVFEIKSLHRMLYLLRQGFLSEDPSAWIELLDRFELFHPNMQYKDEIATLESFDSIRSFFSAQTNQGVRVELQQIWCTGPFYPSEESSHVVLLDYGRVTVLFYLILPAELEGMEEDGARLSIKGTFCMAPNGKLISIEYESGVPIHESYTVHGSE